jgi:hypothetical protein
MPEAGHRAAVLAGLRAKSASVSQITGHFRHVTPGTRTLFAMHCDVGSKYHREVSVDQVFRTS